VEKPAHDYSYLKMTEEAYTRALVDALSGDICLVDGKGVFLGAVADFNNEMCAPRYVKSIKDLYPDDPELVKSFLENIKITLETKNTHVYQYEVKTPLKTRHNEAQFSYLGDDKVLIVNRNITPIMELSSRVYANQAILKAIIENNNDMIFALDLEMRYILFNPAHKRSMKTRYGVDIKIGMPMTRYVRVNEDIGLGMSVFQRVIKGERVIFESDFGTEGMFRGHTQLHVFPLLDESKKIFGIAVFAKDVTAQHELQQQKENYIKMMEYLVSDLSHKLRKPVATILGLVQLVDEEKNIKDLQKILSYLHESTAELDECIRQMTQFLEDHTRTDDTK
jgi:PAS domain S-box-containing protein